jgi:restriction endonuclease Mrr
MSSMILRRRFGVVGHEMEATRYTADGGVDGYLRKDGQLALLQCKRVKGSVGEPILRDLFGTMAAESRCVWCREDFDPSATLGFWKADPDHRTYGTT